MTRVEFLLKSLILINAYYSWLINSERLSDAATGQPPPVAIAGNMTLLLWIRALAEETSVDHYTITPHTPKGTAWVPSARWMMVHTSIAASTAFSLLLFFSGAATAAAGGGGGHHVVDPESCSSDTVAPFVSDPIDATTLMNRTLRRPITASEIETFRRDGVVMLPQMFDQGWIELLKRGFDKNIAAPTSRGRVWDRTAEGQTMFWRSEERV